MEFEEINRLGKAAGDEIESSLRLALTPDVIFFSEANAEFIFGHPIKNHTLLFVDEEAPCPRFAGVAQDSHRWLDSRHTIAVRLPSTATNTNLNS